MKHYDVAVVGATGLVGETLLRVLESSSFPVGKLYMLASEHSDENKVIYNGENYAVENALNFDFSRVKLAWFAIGDKMAKHIIPRAVEAGCWVIDNSEAYRDDPDVPLIIPEINAKAIDNISSRKIVANPNCIVIQLLMSLQPFLKQCEVTRVITSTYQSVSGIGRVGVDDLIDQSHAVLEDTAFSGSSYGQKWAFNLCPQIGGFHPTNNYCKEEMKVVTESEKILGCNSIDFIATTVRVPVFFGHAQSVHIETKEVIDLSAIKKQYEIEPGVSLMPDMDYPTPLNQGMTQDDVFVGRLRYDHKRLNGASFWTVFDNLRKGAALNAVQIAQLLIDEKMLEAAKS